MSEEEWLTPGHRTLEGYLLVVRGSRKKDYGLLGNLVVDVLEERGADVPRYRDIHAVWFRLDPSEHPKHQLVKPFLRYKSGQPIEGLDRECSYHRVRVTATVGETWGNGYGAWITRARGECLEPAKHALSGKEEG